MQAAMSVPYSPAAVASPMASAGQMNGQPFVVVPGQPGMPAQAYPAQAGYPGMGPYPMMTAPHPAPQQGKYHNTKLRLFQN